MTITLPVTPTEKVNRFTTKVLYFAIMYVSSAGISPGDAALDNYLRKTYSCDLKTLVKKLIISCNINQQQRDQITITFKNKQLDDIARVITFGTGKVKGSNLLVHALRALCIERPKKGSN